jgi:hypothetical protein
MAVQDNRRAPFAWLERESLDLIRKRLPATRQAGARNALLALAEAASQRHDGAHQEGDPLRTLAALAGVGERRLREHLQELEGIGLVAITAHRDASGRDLAKTYALLDTPRGDNLAPRGDGARANLAPLARASHGVELQEEEATPSPSASGGGQGKESPRGENGNGRQRRGRRPRRPRRLAAPTNSPTVAWVREHVPDLPERDAVQVVAAAWNQHEQVTSEQVRERLAASPTPPGAHAREREAEAC